AGGRARSRELIDRLQSRGFIEWSERYVEGIVVLDPTTPVERLTIDWATIDRRRRGDQRKLQEMQAYVYTDGCRRAFVLRYFGEEGVSGECGACDVCLGQPLVEPPSSQPRDRAGRRRSPTSPGKVSVASP